MFLSVHLSYRFTDNVAVLKVIINFNEEVEEKPLSTWQTDWALNNTPFRCKCQTLIELSKYLPVHNDYNDTGCLSSYTPNQL